MNKSIFPNVASSNWQKTTYSASKVLTSNGDANIKINKKKKANVLHYVIGASIIVGLVYFAGKKLDNY